MRLRLPRGQRGWLFTAAAVIGLLVLLSGPNHSLRVLASLLRVFAHLS